VVAKVEWHPGAATPVLVALGIAAATLIQLCLLLPLAIIAVGILVYGSGSPLYILSLAKREVELPRTQLLTAQPVPTAQRGSAVRAGRHRALFVATWWRRLRTAALFPVAFRSGLDAAPFRLSSFFVLFYVVVPPLREGPGDQVAKYLLAIPLMLCFLLLAVTRQRINRSPLFPLAPLLLSVAGCIAFANSIFVAPGTGTYSSALIPLISAAIPLLIATHATQADGAVVTEYLFTVFGLAAFFHVLWLVAAWVTDYWVTPPFKALGVLIVFFMILCGLFRRNLLLVLSVALIGFSELLEPTSTVAFLTMFAVAVILLHRLRFWRFLRLACILVAAGIIVANLAVLESSDVAEAFYSIEPSVKEDLGGISHQALADETEAVGSDNAFRLGVLSAARDEMAEHSLLVGKAFSGEVTVDAAQYLTWADPWETGATTIHSDFDIMIVQGGLIGYGLFASLFVGMALLCAKAARLAHAAGDVNSERLFDALQAMNVAFMLCISGNPLMPDLQGTAPYLILLPLAIFLARAQPGFDSLKQQYAAPLRGQRSWHGSRLKRERSY
jgi:hypothetical protein